LVHDGADDETEKFTIDLIVVSLVTYAFELSMFWVWFLWPCR
jgi:hypothetical protein